MNVKKLLEKDAVYAYGNILILSPPDSLCVFSSLANLAREDPSDLIAYSEAHTYAVAYCTEDAGGDKVQPISSVRALCSYLGIGLSKLEPFVNALANSGGSVSSKNLGGRSMCPRLINVGD